jgi:surface antigen
MKKHFIGVLAAVLLLPAQVSALSSPSSNNPTFVNLFGNKQDSLLLLGMPEPQQPLKQLEKPKADKPEPKPVEPPKAPEPVIYTVVEGDNLTKIGTAHNVEWQRIWAKNTSLTHPDVIHIGDKLTIPVASEVIPTRELPAAVSLPTVTPGVSTALPTPVQNSASYDAGNTYDYGYCTWYVKNRRGASLPNSLGNANTWFARAQAAGMATGYTPRAGAVGTTTRGALGHVVYVEAVNGDGTIQISEMNAPKWGVTTYRTANASEFSYIY